MYVTDEKLKSYIIYPLKGVCFHDLYVIILSYIIYDAIRTIQTYI